MRFVCLPFGWVGKNAIFNNRFSNFCIAIFFIRLPLRRQSIFICWIGIRNGIRVMCTLLNIFLFEFCFSFVFFPSRSLQLKYVMHVVLNSLTHWLIPFFLFLGFVSRWISFHVVFLADLHSVADIDFHKLQKDTRATHRYCLWRRKIMRHVVQTRAGIEREEKKTRRKMCLLNAT